VSAWYFDDKWLLGYKHNTGTDCCGALADSLGASSECIDNDSVWRAFVPVQKNITKTVPVSMRGITTAALNVEALAAATLAAETAFDEAIEQAAPSFVLSGLDSNHSKAALMGIYERQDEQQKVNGRFVYQGPNGMWVWSGDCGREWNFGEEEDIGQRRCAICVRSSAPTPESIMTKLWGVMDKDPEWHSTNLTTTAINYKPAELFKGTCIYCVQCREWRRCCKGEDAMYCSEACLRAHLQKAQATKRCA
jgi:hypothetical protein